jgi:predicted transglutaminase-like cysteine proteinase
MTTTNNRKLIVLLLLILAISVSGCTKKSSITTVTPRKSTTVPTIQTQIIQTTPTSETSATTTTTKGIVTTKTPSVSKTSETLKRIIVDGYVDDIKSLNIKPIKFKPNTSIPASASPSVVYILANDEWIYVAVELYGNFDQNKRYVLDLVNTKTGESFNIKYDPKEGFMTAYFTKSNGKYKYMRSYETYGAFRNHSFEIVSKCFKIAKNFNYASLIIISNKDKYIYKIFENRKLEKVIPSTKPELYIKELFGINLREPIPLKDVNKFLTFDKIISQLDTPEKLSKFMKMYFIYEYHDGCTAYTPKEFFKVRRGDCKDYAVFSSYVLKLHGYDTKMLAFKFSKNSSIDGHVVTIFRDKNGKLYYMSFADIYDNVTSIQDILNREKDRIKADRILSYRIIEAGNIDTCIY